MENSEYISPKEVCPMWSVAVEAIRERFEAESYDMIITHEELKELMGIQPVVNVEDVKKEQFDYLSGIERTKEALLEDYNLFLYPVIGKGYQILHPNEQVRKGADHYVRKSQRALSKSMNTLVNVDADLLDVEGKGLQVLKMHRVAFVKAAFRKRNFPKQETKKQIEK